MLERIDDAIGTLGLSDPKLVFVGDYIDRGPSSAGVLRRLHELSTEFPNNVTCLLGNHEQMMLDFIDAPAAHHARWFRNGAEATVASFAVSAPSEDLAASADAVGRGLRQALGGLDSWLRSLPTQTSSGNLTVVHAGIDPRRDLSDQTVRVLLWGHPEFLTHARSDGTWIAHGHTIMAQPVFADGRISVDTGAYQTGLLSRCSNLHQVCASSHRSCGILTALLIPSHRGRGHIKPIERHNADKTKKKIWSTHNENRYRNTDRPVRNCTCFR